MNKRFLCVVAGLAFFHQAAAYDVLINVTGTIAADTCTVSNESIDVSFGEVATKQFPVINSAGAKTKFVIGLENCMDRVATAKVRFKGTADSDNIELLQLTQTSDVATGLAIEIMDADSATIALGTETALPIIGGVGNNNELVFYAQYRSTSDTVSAGKAHATANFVLEYE